jgi:hypothetical protein
MTRAESPASGILSDAGADLDQVRRLAEGASKAA